MSATHLEDPKVLHLPCTGDLIFGQISTKRLTLNTSYLQGFYLMISIHMVCTGMTNKSTPTSTLKATKYCR